MNKQPNILFIMCDQYRYDAIGALGNPNVKTPNIDRLVKRGVTFDNAYSTCPVCVPARYTVRTGREPFNTGYYGNAGPDLNNDQATGMEDRCGNYLGKTLRNHGYRTFGIGKFHSMPTYEDLGYDVHLHSEELWDDTASRHKDAYAQFLRTNHPEFNFIEQLHGERTDMYYMPQTSLLPPELTVERWAADRAVEQIGKGGDKPYFGMVSFIGPHPPLAPPIPYNRWYNPDDMPNPIKGDIEVDHMDEQIPWMNHVIWAEDINDSHARSLKARYYGEISYIDDCIGRILDTVEATDEADNTLICFFSDHGDHMGDHHAWQKESFFDAAARIPFLVSWPEQLEAGAHSKVLTCLTDLFAIATKAAGHLENRDGKDLLGIIKEDVSPRDYLHGYHGTPGSTMFKVMVRDERYKYIYMANGRREQLFDLINDPYELDEVCAKFPEVHTRLKEAAIKQLTNIQPLNPALESGGLLGFEYKPMEKFRIHQFASDLGVRDFLK